MKKWCVSVLLFCLLAVSAVGCGGQTTTAPAAFETELLSAEFEYDGSPHGLTLSGNIPEGTETVWTNNDQTMPGEYIVTAELTKEGYAPLTLSAKLTITALTFEGLSMADITVPYGQSYRPAVSGAPEGADIAYTYSRDGQSSEEAPVLPGEYTVEATIAATGYETAALSAKLTITALTFDAAVTLEQEDIRYGEELNPQLLNRDKLPDGVTISAFRYERIEGDSAVPLDSVPEAVGSYRVLCTVSCANYMTKEYSAEFDISGLTITEIAIGNKPYGAYLPENTTWALTLSVLPAENYEDVPIDFTSSDEEVATVSENGTVTALKAGSVTITASVRGYSPAVTDAYELVVFATDRMREDFETVYVFNAESKSGAGKVPFSAGAGSASMQLSLTDSAADLPEGGSGTALKVEYTGSAEYSTVEWAFGEVTAGQRYELRYAVKVLSGNHNAIFQIRVGENTRSLAGSGAGSRSVVFTATEAGTLTLLLAPGVTGAYTITIDNLTLRPVDGFLANFDNAVVRQAGTQTQVYAETAADDYFYVGTENGTRSISLLSVAELTGSDGEKAEAAGMYGQAICITSNIDASVADGYRQIEMGWRLPALSPGTYSFTFRVALLAGNHLRRIGVAVDGANPYIDMTSDGTGQVDFTVTSGSVTTVVIRIVDNQVSPGSRLLLDDFAITAVPSETGER